MDKYEEHHEIKDKAKVTIDGKTFNCTGICHKEYCGSMTYGGKCSNPMCLQMTELQQENSRLKDVVAEYTNQLKQSSGLKKLNKSRVYNFVRLFSSNATGKNIFSDSIARFFSDDICKRFGTPHISVDEIEKIINDVHIHEADTANGDLLGYDLHSYISRKAKEIANSINKQKGGEDEAIPRCNKS